MRKLLVVLTAALMVQTAAFAQKTVAKENVLKNYVTDFEKNYPEVQNVKWVQYDSLNYEATFTNDGVLQQVIYSNKGTEKRWYVEQEYTPKAIKDTLANSYQGYKIKHVCIVELRGKMTYQVRIYKKGGLFGRKQKDPKQLNFETNGKFIDAISL
ncbi:MAG: hypothetical protein J5605_05305 [Bacteroidales bacterium]|nr:hypothetical protein [Bacteroidales bacterium]